MMYPIYRVVVHWSEACLPGAENRVSTLPPLPKGRFWNGTNWDLMQRDESPVDEIAARLQRDWWPNYAAKRREPADLTITVRALGRDTWCSDWFSHWTFDVGQSDEETLSSFREYVERIRYSDRSENEVDSFLMGAEDEWRWHGCTDGDPQGARTKAPCRCQYCVKRGVLRIDH